MQHHRTGKDRGRRPPPQQHRSREQADDRDSLVTAALELIEARGEPGFSVRGLAAATGLDPMTVLHHLGSRDGAVRAAADRLMAELPLPPPSVDWRAELRGVADAFRALARRRPRAFPLLLRFAATGPADYAQGERVYAALLRAGLDPPAAARIGLAFYAVAIGIAAAESGGLLDPAAPEEVEELAALDPHAYPATRALSPEFRHMSPERAADAGIAAFLDGLSRRPGVDPEAKTG